jgi:hypothetical protein
MLCRGTPCARVRASQSVKDFPILQDAPPPGGFPAIRWVQHGSRQRSGAGSLGAGPPGEGTKGHLARSASGLPRQPAESTAASEARGPAASPSSASRPQWSRMASTRCAERAARRLWRGGSSAGPWREALTSCFGTPCAPAQLASQKKDTRFQADEIQAVRQIVHPVLQAEWDLRCAHGWCAHGCRGKFFITSASRAHLEHISRAYTSQSTSQSMGAGHGCPRLPGLAARGAHAGQVRTRRYMEHQRKQHEAEAEVMKNVRRGAPRAH